MVEEKKTKYMNFSKLAGMITGIIFVLGISYAVFRTTDIGKKLNRISAADFQVVIENEQDEILLKNAFPMTEEEGLSLKPYTFDVANKGTLAANYDLYIEVDESISTLPTNVIRYYLTAEENGQEMLLTTKSMLLGGQSTIKIDGKTLYQIHTTDIDVNKSDPYKLYLWIDEEATTEQAVNKTFEARVRVEATQKAGDRKLLKVNDVSENNDGSIAAYVYSDGTAIIRGEGRMASNLASDGKLKVVDEDGVVQNYKQLFIQMGYDVTDIKTMDDVNRFMDEQSRKDNDFQNKFDEYSTVFLVKQVLEEMGHDVSNKNTMDDLLMYLIEIGYMDEQGNPTELGNLFMQKFESIYMSNFSTEGYDPFVIIIEEGITNVATRFLYENNTTFEVILPSTILSIDDSAFSSSNGLINITIPSGVQTIGNSAFSSCSKLTSIVLPDSLTSIGSYAFYNCTSIKSITIPNTVTIVESYAFSNWKYTQQINIDNTEEFITSHWNTNWDYNANAKVKYMR